MPPVIDLKTCNSCQKCDRFCPGDIIHMEPSQEGKRKVPVVAYPEECTHCGICRLECPENCVSYQFPPMML